jgi:DNA transposition AAA+ family ATPase
MESEPCLKMNIKNDIQKGLERDVSLAAENVRAVAESLRLFIEKNRLSQRRVAELLGVSGGMVHQFLSVKGYKGDTQKLCDKIVHLINNVERKARQGHAGRFVDTTVAKRIATFISQCDAFSVGEGKLGLVIGDGGHGKSVCLQQYAGANRNAIYILLDDTMRSRGIFKEIALALKVNCYGVTSDVTGRIVASLRCRNLIVILDEASGLSVEQLNSLRQIIPVKGRCPLILAGNRQLLNTVMERATRREAASLEQFTSRLVGVLNLDELGADKGGGLYTAEDIRRLYEYDGIGLTGDAVSLLRCICRTAKSGRLRTCSVIITALHTSEAAEIDARLIIAAIEQLQLPVRAWLPVPTRDIAAEEKVVAAVRTA